MTFQDALAASTGVAPITRMTKDGYLMLGYLDGSVSVTKKKLLVKRLGAGTGPVLGYTDWQPGEDARIIHGRPHDAKQAEGHE